MGYTNSSLVNVKLLSPNHSGLRTKKIDTITIHCFVGQVTAKRGCEIFLSKNKKASCNYVIGYDGSIGLCVEEKNRSWCTGGSLKVNGETGSINDQHAITIEVASEAEPPYKITDKAYKSLILLCADICRRNNIDGLKWRGDKSYVGKPHIQNITCHRWFANKACPGDYIYNRLGQIANDVNSELNNSIKDNNKVVYDKIDELPDYMVNTIRKLVDNGYLKGIGDNKLGITDDIGRILVILDRAGVFDK